MFFTTVDGLLEQLPETSEEIVSIELPFRGDLSGVFRLDVSFESARCMTAAFLADEPEQLSPTRIGEAMCELANMICGGALSHMPCDHVFELLSPHLRDGDGADDRAVWAAERAATHIFQLEDGFLRVSIEVQ
jgi:hypothetical protein